MAPEPAADGGLDRPSSKQLLWLVVAGAVCLAIFITGVVLFVTTKF